MATSDRSTAKRYFYAEGGQRRGPVTVDELRELAANGKLSRSDMVWQEGVEKARPASWVQGVFSATPSDCDVAVSRPPEAPRSDTPQPMAADTSPVCDRLFVSHSSHDAETALQIATALEAAGIGCWIAPRDIPAGAEYNTAIMNGLQSSRALVLVHSRESATSKKVFQEVHQADARGLPIFPIRIDDTKSPPELALLISTYQWIDAYPPPVSRHLDRLVAAVTQSLRMPGNASQPDLEKIPRYIGPYQIRKEIGEGGMGTVFFASQLSPIKRDVAIKRIKLGLDTKEVLARFESERQALARMNHPNIASVLDAGADVFGRPYFVMEYVPGTPITEFADKNKLPIAKRLDLFKQVCQAIAHAHTKGIIHRDIKSSNILAYLQNRMLTAKVIDFGIAKATGGERLTDRSYATESGFVVGTYDAMSPEQAEGSPDIDTRTDVYSLGVLLYELLTGAKPFDQETLAKAPDSEVRRMIREVEAPRPSARLSSIGRTGPQIAAARGTEVGSLTKTLRSELEWIPMMAMRKERERRYASPLDLAEDIDNYLANRPLKAGPEALSYRLRKSLRRNRTPVVAALLILAFVIGGTTAYVSNIRIAQRRTAEALVEAELQRNEAQRQSQLAKEKEQLAREAAETAKQQSQLALDTLQTVIFDVQRGLTNLPGSGEVRRNLLASVMQHIDRLSGQYVDRSRVDRDMMAALIEMGDVVLRLGAGTDVAASAPGAPDEDKAPSSAEAGGAAATARTLYQRSFSIAKKLAESHPGEAQAQRDLSVAYDKLGDVTLERGQAADALKHYQDSFEIRRKFAEPRPDDPEAQRDLAISYNNLGNATLQLGQTVEALKYYQVGLEISRRFFEKNPGDAQAERDLSVSYNKLGNVALQLGQTAEALKYYQDDLEITRRLAKTNPSNAQNQRDLAITYNRLGDVALQSGQTADALNYYQNGLEASRQLAESNVGDAQDQHALMLAFYKLARAEKQRFEYEAAQRYHGEASKVLQRMIAAGLLKEQAERELATIKREIENCASAVIAVAGLSQINEAEAAMRPKLLYMRCVELARRGDMAAVAETAETLHQLAGEDAGILYLAASGYSLCVRVFDTPPRGGVFLPPDPARDLSLDEQSSREKYVKLALETLARAVGAGYKKADELRKDDDLTPLRTLPEFLKLVDGISGGAG